MRNRSRLVEDEMIDATDLLQRLTRLEEDPVFRTSAHPDGHCERRCQSHRTRQGNDQHGNHPQHRLGEITDDKNQTKNESSDTAITIGTKTAAI